MRYAAKTLRADPKGLDANMVRSAISGLPPEEVNVLLIKNVGNLVRPVEFRVGGTRG